MPAQMKMTSRFDTCACPSWWGCEKRVCYEQAKRDYADPKLSYPTGKTYVKEGPERWDAYSQTWYRESVWK